MERGTQPLDSTAEALVGVIDAGQQLLAERLELSLIEGRRYFRQLAIRFCLLLLGGLVLIGGMVLVDCALVDRARQTTAGPTSLYWGVILHAAIGAALIVFGLRRREGTPR